MTGQKQNKAKSWDKDQDAKLMILVAAWLQHNKTEKNDIRLKVPWACFVYAGEHMSRSAWSVQSRFKKIRPQENFKKTMQEIWDRSEIEQRVEQVDHNCDWSWQNPKPIDLAKAQQKLFVANRNTKQQTSMIIPERWFAELEELTDKLNASGQYEVFGQLDINTVMRMALKEGMQTLSAQHSKNTRPSLEVMP